MTFLWVLIFSRKLGRSKATARLRSAGSQDKWSVRTCTKPLDNHLQSLILFGIKVASRKSVLGQSSLVSIRVPSQFRLAFLSFQPEQEVDKLSPSARVLHLVWCGQILLILGDFPLAHSIQQLDRLTPARDHARICLSGFLFTAPEVRFGFSDHLLVLFLNSNVVCVSQVFFLVGKVLPLLMNVLKVLADFICVHMPQKILLGANSVRYCLAHKLSLCDRLFLLSSHNSIVYLLLFLSLDLTLNLLCPVILA